jgi:transcriptional regulator with XRE-family HTH domain
MHGRQLVGLNLRRLRVAQNISQERLAFESSVDRSYLGGLERGEENPTVDLLDRLADTLGVPIGELFVVNKNTGKGPLGLKRGRRKHSIAIVKSAKS